MSRCQRGLCAGGTFDKDGEVYFGAPGQILDVTCSREKQSARNWLSKGISEQMETVLLMGEGDSQLPPFSRLQTAGELSVPAPML